MITLILDTADNKKVTVGLEINGIKHVETRNIDSNKTQVILPMIDKILKKYSVTPKYLSGIQVNVGPGSFTGLRVGIAIANALAFVLKIPVNGKTNKIILPSYK
ncbi:MAG: tRNA (adenosine(37)-N6)-threonylcarbamoyltransferase complex dimerization subunit type 1 TsaB [Candidatus Levybacteria bacterium]|nr:tRNA (adenosine(37)-N6)-threonylcarbamoyltransferase complex dimerization subunit type 1 TsaB [Candidatus Levybacteria bacterium]